MAIKKAEKNWTLEQQYGITADCGCVLVSAAAGSGKTSVLTERVITKITDPKNPVDVDKFLIITFTKAAAQEMKTRISARLQELIRQNPEDSNLHRQKLLLKTAQIGTIHSFCSSLLKENFFKAGISHKFRIADDEELAKIKATAIEKVLNRFFEVNSSDHILTADLFTDEKSDVRLSEIIKSVYEYTRSFPFPQKWMNEKIKMYDNVGGNMSSAWEHKIIDYTKFVASELLGITNETLEMIKANETTQKAYEKSISSDRDSILKIIDLADMQNFENISVFLSNLKFEKIGILKNKELECEKELIKSRRNYIKSSIDYLKEIYSVNCKKREQTTDIMRRVTTVIFDAVNYYESEINSMKLRRNLLDFNDLEHKTLELLVENSTENHSAGSSSVNLIKSDIAKEISERFSEIMVDEYQDVNDIQDTIFKMISKNEENIFMVGDVKQSIYKFRESRPEIFLHKKHSFPFYDPLKKQSFAKILLGKNFRSHEQIIDGINFIFEKLMSKDVGEIEYDSEESLIPGAIYSLNNGANTSIKIVDIQNGQENKHVLEATEIAKTIVDLIASGYEIETNGSTRPIAFSDICILLRNSNSYAHIYADTLQKCGIPTCCEMNEEFLKTTEISTMISLLKIVNNPTIDISLVATMLAPFFGFTMDEIAEIRITNKTVPFYFALKKFAENGSKKAMNFCEKIKLYRNLSAVMSCDELIEFIYNDTKYPEICLSAPDGRKKRANLSEFLEYAKKLENEYHSGLVGFLNFISNAESRLNNFRKTGTFSNLENAVKIMSIHKSKGLEFPVCIVADLDHKFNLERDDFLIHPDLGIGFKIKNENGMVIYDNLIRKAILLKISEEDLSEEMRILYVALTRAKQKLILISACKKVEKKITSIFALTYGTNTISPHIVQNAKSFLDWILLAISQSDLKNKIGNLLQIPFINHETCEPKKLNWSFEIISPEEKNETDENSLNLTAQGKTTPARHEFKIDKSFLKIIQNRLDFEYKNKHLVDLVLKISASELAHSDGNESFVATSKPEFAFEKGLTPMHRGTAMHEFMCYCDITKLTSENIPIQAERLLKKRFLTTYEYNSLDINALKKFAESNLAKRISNSKNVLREHRFYAKIPTNKIFNDRISGDKSKYEDTFVVVQGALDCIFEENGEYVIVDYKTDKANNMCELYEKYKKQLEIYRYAMEETKNIKVKEIGIYSFNLNAYFAVTD